MKIRSRLFLLASGVMVLTLGVLMGALFHLQRRYLSDQIQHREQRLFHSVEESAHDALLSDDRLFLISQLKFLKTLYPELRFGTVVWMEGGREQALRMGPETPEDPSSVPHELRVEDPIRPNRTVRIGFALDQKTLKNEFAYLTTALFRKIFSLVATLFVLGVALSFLLARSFTEPIESLSAAAAAIGQGKAGIQLAYSRQDEFGNLIRDFNQMSERLAELDQMKKDLLASVSHEFKSPLSVIDSIADTVQAQLKSGENPSREELGEFVSQVRLSDQRLLRLVNDLLDAARIEQGVLKCHLHPLDLSSLLKSVVDLFDIKAKKQRVNLVLTVDPPCPPVQADPDRIHQVLVNLITNALKFTPPGGTVSVHANPEGGSPPGVRVTVGDTGVGLEEDDVGRLFQKFQQGKNVGQRNANSPKGTGLGLFIVKSIVEQHGGEISVQSAPGQGSRFTFTLRAV